MLEFTEVRFTVEGIELGIPEKVIIVLLWLLTETIGNGLLFGLIQFDIFAGDPLKRRITDQVCTLDLFNYFGRKKCKNMFLILANVHLLHATDM